MPYPEEMVAPMREELVHHGVTELRDDKAVDEFMAAGDGSALIFFNSVCGCAAGSARPGLAMSLTGQTRPDRIATVFAGQDVEATHRARAFCPQVPPSSPSAALFKNGELVHFIPRHLIEGQAPETVAELFTDSYTEFCS